jgi:hypothetical protein
MAVVSCRADHRIPLVFRAAVSCRLNARSALWQSPGVVWGQRHVVPLPPLGVSVALVVD